MPKSTVRYPLPAHLRRAKALAWLLDGAITLPWVKTKIGLDPLLGVIPGGGDVAGFVLGLYIVWVAYDLNVSEAELKKMVWRLLVDQLTGLVPVVGDLFDVFSRPNTKNIAILEAHYHQTQGHQTASEQIIDIKAETAES